MTAPGTSSRGVSYLKRMRNATHYPAPIVGSVALPSLVQAGDGRFLIKAEFSATRSSCSDGARSMSSQITDSTSCARPKSARISKSPSARDHVQFFRIQIRDIGVHLIHRRSGKISSTDIAIREEEVVSRGGTNDQKYSSSTLSSATAGLRCANHARP